MTESTERAPIDPELLSEHLSAGERESVREFVAGLDPADAAHFLSRLDNDDRAALLAQLEPEDSAVVVQRLPQAQACDALDQVDAQSAARVLEELPSDDRADVLNELETSHAEAILLEMHPDEASDLRELASYPDDTAGGLMLREFVRIPLTATVGDVVDELRDRSELYKSYDVQYLYVEDAEQRLVGVLPMRVLLFATRRTPIEGVMIRKPHSVKIDTELLELTAFFDEHRFFGVPVVDENGVLKGVLRRRAVETAIAEESEETFRASQGIVGGEELRSMPLLVRSRRRLAWLSVNIWLNVLAASVIAYFQDTLEAVIALTVFLPIISDMSGCSGSQAVAVSIRELTLGVARPSDVMRVLGRELGVGLLNGAALGLLICGVAYLWKGNVWLGLVVGGALAVNTIIAVCVGGAVPLVLKRLNRDPALASGPILTTVTDMCGFLIVLSLASGLVDRLS